MQYIKNIFNYIFFGLGALGFIIIYGTFRAKGFNWYIFGTGVICLAAAVIYVVVVEWLSRDKDAGRQLLDLKRHGVQIPVDLTKCKIKSNQWTSETRRYHHPRVEFLNEISGHGDKNVERMESNVSIVEYTTKVSGRTRTFRSNPVGKDKISLTMLLEMQKETTIYLDPKNKRIYYFDLEFLEDEG
jgi:hypothetical protein